MLHEAGDLTRARELARAALHAAREMSEMRLYCEEIERSVSDLLVED